MTYILVDTANTFFRARHIVKDNNPDTKVGLAMHIILNSIKKAWNDFNGSHVVFCLEGRSWRKDHYTRYKANRDLARAALTEHEVEADDLIAGWVKEHPNDDHVIISSDSDFAQLITPNVKQYNGISNVLTTHEGYYTDTKEPIIDKKTGEPKKAPNPQWLLFEKCMRGDTSDNIFSAYPGVRKKGTKNKIGLLEAFDDRNKQGYNWNNLMLQRWVDHDGKEHKVLDDYERNRKLIDLSEQPKWVKTTMDETITEVVNKPKIPQVGIHFMKFCGKYNLQRIGSQIQDHALYLTAGYNNVN